MTRVMAAVMPAVCSRARITSATAMMPSPVQPGALSRSPTIRTASSAARAGSDRVIVVAVLAGTVVSPNPNSR